MAKIKGKGSLRHQRLQRNLAHGLIMQGKNAVIEAFIGKNVDILVNDSGKIIAIEIQLSTQHCLQNIIRDIRFGCDEVWIACISERVLENIKIKIKQHLDNSLLNKKIKFYLIKDLFPHAHKNNTIKRNKVSEENSGMKQMKGGESDEKPNKV